MLCSVLFGWARFRSVFVFVVVVAVVVGTLNHCSGLRSRFVHVYHVVALALALALLIALLFYHSAIVQFCFTQNILLRVFCGKRVCLLLLLLPLAPPPPFGRFPCNAFMSVSCVCRVCVVRVVLCVVRVVLCVFFLGRVVAG